MLIIVFRFLLDKSEVFCIIIYENGKKQMKCKKTHSVIKYYKLNNVTKWLVISCLFFGFGDVLTTALCLTTVPVTDGYELSPIWNAYYHYLGPWFGSIPLLIAKYLVLILACYGALQARDKGRKIYEWLFILIYLVTHLGCVINNTYALILMLYS